MSMRIHKLTTYLQPEEAYTLVEFLEQLRDVLLQTYGDEISVMLQANAPPASDTTLDEEVPF